MSIGKTTAIAKAVSAVSWAAESTVRIASKGTKSLIGAIKDKKYYDVEIIVDGVITTEKNKVTPDEIGSMLKTLDYIPSAQIIIKQRQKGVSFEKPQSF